jgi:hypothetical protein
MKITYGMIVIDGMPFIKHQLKTIYPHAHQIIICEGGDNKWNEINKYRTSKDGTIEFIKNYPDPQNKIKLIQKQWSNKNEMCFEYSKYATGDIIWHIDIDEFVDPQHIPTIKKLLEKYSIISIPNLVFWGDTETIIEAKQGNKWNRYWFNFERIFKRHPKYYINHIPDRGYYDPKTKRVLPGIIAPQKELFEKGIYTYHFSYILPESVKNKLKYYNHRTPGCILNNWYENIFQKFAQNKQKWTKEDFNIQPINPAKYSSFPERIRPLNIKLPQFLQELKKELSCISMDNGTHQ